jgi:hypothetical protein
LPFRVHHAQEQHRAREPFRDGEDERSVDFHLEYLGRTGDADGRGRGGLGPFFVHLHERLLIHAGEVEPFRADVCDAGAHRSDHRPTSGRGGDRTIYVVQDATYRAGEWTITMTFTHDWVPLMGLLQ